MNCRWSAEYLPIRREQKDVSSFGRFRLYQPFDAICWEAEDNNPTGAGVELHFDGQISCEFAGNGVLGKIVEDDAISSSVDRSCFATFDTGALDRGP